MEQNNKNNKKNKNILNKKIIIKNNIAADYSN